MPILTPEQAQEIINQPDLRREAAKTFLGFCLIYLPHYFTRPRADFHPELIDDLSDWDKQFLAITGFRGSAKTTYCQALVLFAALEGRSKFIVPINETDDVTRMTIENIRYELEFNEMVQSDYGNLLIKERSKTKFTDSTIVLQSGVRVLGRSRGQKVRGLKHRQSRPDFILIDDPEEREKVQKKEYRDKSENWLTGDVIPACEANSARLIVIGNELHTDALMARLSRHPLFLHKAYPLIKGEEIWENCTWKGMYATPEALARQELKVGRTAFLREYMLKVVPPDGQEVKPEWIKYYKPTELPKNIVKIGTGTDLAISKNETADYTAMVSGILSIVEGRPKIYILGNPINARLSFHETIQQMKTLGMALRMYGGSPQFYVEKVAYQQAAIEEAQRNMIPVTAVTPGHDKRARLRTAAIFIQNGTVVFADKGCEDLIAQILGFGVEDHDDLVDALVYLILALADEGMRMPEVILL